MPNPSHPVVIGTNTVSQALADPVFMTQLPEFKTLQTKLTTMRVDLTVKRGCSSCRKKRVARNMYRDFMSILTSLTPEGLVRLKRYLNADNLLLNVVNTKTNRIEPKVV